MKTINLRDENYNWKCYEYMELSDLEVQLKKNRVSIGNKASIGDGASIGSRVSIGNDVIIGDDVNIGDEASIGDDVSIGDNVNIGYGASIKKYKQYILIAEKFAKIK